MKIHLLDPHTYSMVFGCDLCEMARKLKNGAEISHVIQEFEKQMNCMEIVLGPVSYTHLSVATTPLTVSKSSVSSCVR